jgi:hypothetical protein
MFPPEVTEEPERWLNNLWLSLRRAGDHFGNNARVFEKEDGTVEAVLYLQDRLPSDISRTVNEYIKGYSKACGWSVRSCRIEKGQVVLRASRASSSLSRKR